MAYKVGGGASSRKSMPKKHTTEQSVGTASRKTSLGSKLNRGGQRKVRAASPSRSGPTSRVKNVSTKMPGAGQRKGRVSQVSRASATKGARVSKAAKTMRAKQEALGATVRIRRMDLANAAGQRSSRSSSGTSGLKKYPGSNTPGGAIGAAHQSFFDIGNFLKNR